MQCHAELKELLPKGLRGNDFQFPLHKSRSVKDLIESMGIPHTEVDIIMVDGQSVDFSWQIRGGESIRLYPVSSPPQQNSMIHNQPATPVEPRFVIDVHLGKLAGYLRLLGFDTLYRNDYEDPELARISDLEQRILVSCDRKLLMRKRVKYGYLMRSRKAFKQSRELRRRYQLSDYRSAVVRCMECNGVIHAVEKTEVETKLQPLTRLYYHEFYRCNGCRKIYWKGSHYTKMQELVQAIQQGVLPAESGI